MVSAAMIARQLPILAEGALAARIPAGERVYAIGDVHGRLDLFDALAARIAEDAAGRPPARVHVVLLGDIVDRGPDSAAIVARCLALAARSDRFVLLKGNHEATLAQALSGDIAAVSHWLRVGGDATLASWGVDRQLMLDGDMPRLLREARARVTPRVVEQLGGLPLTHRIGDYLFVHAGIRPEVALADQQETDLLWIRQGFLESEADLPFVVVHGHTVTSEADVRRNRIGIDTGAYRTGILTALGLEGGERWIVSADAPAQPCAQGRIADAEEGGDERDPLRHLVVDDLPAEQSVPAGLPVVPRAAALLRRLSSYF